MSSVSSGKAKYKYSVKVFLVNTKNLEKDLNDCLNNFGKYQEIINIDLSSSPTETVAVVLYREEL